MFNIVNGLNKLGIEWKVEGLSRGKTVEWVDDKRFEDWGEGWTIKNDQQFEPHLLIGIWTILDENF